MMQHYSVSHTAPPNRPPKPAPQNQSKQQPVRPPKPPPKEESPIFRLIPKALYDPDTQKIFGVFRAEELLIAALILILLQDKKKENTPVVYALAYILLSDFGL